MFSESDLTKIHLSSALAIKENLKGTMITLTLEVLATMTIL